MALAQLVAARGTKQQGGAIGLGDGLAAVAGQQFVADLLVVQAGGHCQPIELVQLQPEVVVHRGIELGGADQRPEQRAQGALDGGGQQGAAFAALAFLDHDQLVAGGQQVLQGLAEIGHLARALVEHDGLVEHMTFELLADPLHVRAQGFEQAQARFRRQDQPVEFQQALIEQPGEFAQLGPWQLLQPALEAGRGGVTKRQAALIGRRYPQHELWPFAIHSPRTLLVRWAMNRASRREALARKRWSRGPTWSEPPAVAPC